MAGTCVESGTGVDAPRLDAALPVPDGGPIDASNACAAPSSAAFGAATLIPGLSSAAGDGTPSLTDDRLELYFKSERNGTYDVFVTKRATASTAWPAPVIVSELSDALASDTGVEVSPDGLTLWLSSNRAGGIGALDIYMATRATRQSAWSAPVHVPALSSAGEDEGIMVLPGALVAYLHSNRRGMGYMEVFRASRSSVAAAWSAPVLVDELAAGSGENPWVTADDCTMYFQTARDAATGGGDIWIAHRPMRDQPFGSLAPVPSLSSTAYDADPVLTPDLKYALVVSTRTGGPGSYDMFEATR